MEIATLIEIDACPRCGGQPRVVRDAQYQARCGCGACGPKTKSAHEAALRWRSVAHYMREHEASVALMLQSVVPEKPRTAAFHFFASRKFRQ